MQGRRELKICRHVEDIKKNPQKQQAEVFCSNIDRTAVCLALLFSINTDVKKLNQYKRQSNDIDKQGANGVPYNKILPKSFSETILNIKI